MRNACLLLRYLFLGMFAVLLLCTGSWSQDAVRLWRVFESAEFAHSLNFDSSGSRLMRGTLFEAIVHDAHDGSVVARIGRGNFETVFKKSSLSDDGREAFLVVEKQGAGTFFEARSLSGAGTPDADAHRHVFPTHSLLHHVTNGTGTTHLVSVPGETSAMSNDRKDPVPLPSDIHPAAATVARSGVIHGLSNQGVYRHDRSGLTTPWIPGGDVGFSPGHAILTPDETRMAIADITDEDYRDIVRIYDLRERRVVADLVSPDDEDSYTADMVFSGEDLLMARLVYGDKDAQEIRIFRLGAGHKPSLVHVIQLGGEGATVAFSPDASKMAVSRTGGALELYSLLDLDVASATTEEEPLPPRLIAGLGHADRITSVDLSADGDLIATAGSNGLVWLWDAQSNRAIFRQKLSGDMLVKFAEDKSAIFALDDQHIYQIATDTGGVISQLRGLGDRPLLLHHFGDARGFLACSARRCVTHSGLADDWPQSLELPRGPYQQAIYSSGLLVLSGKQEESHYLRFVDPDEPQDHRSVPVDAAISHIGCGQDHEIVLGTEDGQVMRLDPSGDVLAKRLLGEHAITGIGNAVAGEVIIAMNGTGYVNHDDLPATIFVVDAATLVIEKSAPLPVLQNGLSANVSQLGNSQDGQKALVATHRGLAKPGQFFLWQSAISKLSSGPATAARAANRLQFTPDGQSLSVSFRNSSVRWSLQTGKSSRALSHTLFGSVISLDDSMTFVSQTGFELERKGMTLTSPFSMSAPMLKSDYPLDSRLIAANDTLVAGRFGESLVWPFGNGGGRETQMYVLPSPDGGSGDWRNLDRTGQWLLIQSFQQITMHDLGNQDGAAPLQPVWRTGLEEWRLPVMGPTLIGAGFSQDNGHLLVEVESNDFSARYPAVLALDPLSGKVTGTFENSLAVHVPALGSVPDTKMILTVTDDDSALLVTSPADPQSMRIGLSGLNPLHAIADNSARALIVAGYGETLLWRASDGTSTMLDAEIAGEAAVAFSLDGKLVALAETNGSVSLWRVESGERLARLLTLANGDWVVVGEQGRYDAADPGNVEGVSWVLPDAPLHPVPIETYYLDYYEPRLLQRLIAAEEFPPLPLPSDRNRVTPIVEMSEIVLASEPGGARDHVRVTLRIAEGVSGENTSGLGALKLFRNNQLVASDSSMAFDADGTAQISFNNIRLPSDETDFVFSAYVFNADGIKSETADRLFERPHNGVIEPAKAYVLAVGVNAYDNPAWNLRYAASDAEANAELISAGLRASGAFSDVIDLALISRSNTSSDSSRLARRDVIEAVLESMAGKPANADWPADVAEIAAGIPPANPQDVVYLAFAGHGLATSDGRFHFFPQEFGGGTTGRVVNDASLSQSLNSDRLADLLLQIDVRDLVLVIDACNSAASVEGGGFRPGPMGSRGLGQLAYDKSMRVLAASQSEEVALESDQLLHGALSYALLREGLEAQYADRAPKNGSTTVKELLDFATERVPSLYQELRTGTIKPLGRGAFSLADSGTDKKTIPIQNPALFDFRRSNNADVVLRMSEN